MLKLKRGRTCQYTMLVEHAVTELDGRIATVSYNCLRGNMDDLGAASNIGFGMYSIQPIDGTGVL